MKTMLFSVILLISSYAIAQTKSWEQEFDSVDLVFKENLKSYINKYVKLQVPHSKSEDASAEILRKTYYLSYWEKAVALTDGLKKYYINQPDLKPNELTKLKIFQLLENSYRHEFMGLDKAYFDKVKAELKL